MSKLKVVTVMPCYDKKLEAVRPNFDLVTDTKLETLPKEIDTVLATHELVDMFEEKGINIREVVPMSNDIADTEMTPVEL